MQEHPFYFLIFDAQIIELPEHGLETLTVIDLNLNENELGYLGESLAKAPRLKVSLDIWGRAWPRHPGSR